MDMMFEQGDIRYVNHLFNYVRLINNGDINCSIHGLAVK